MFVFGLNLPVAEILFVVLLLTLITLVVIVIQLVRMRRNIKVLDETTLEIRRYEQEEDVALKAFVTDLRAFGDQDRRMLVQYVGDNGRLVRACSSLLVRGDSPRVVRERLIANGVSEQLATKLVNDAIAALERCARNGVTDARSHARIVAKAARRRL